MSNLENIFKNKLNNRENIGTLEKNDKVRFEIITFSIGNMISAIEIKYILEIISNILITKLYKVDSFITGVTNIRGQIKPVIDLEVFFNYKNSKSQNQKKGIILSYNGFDVIILVPEIDRVLWIYEDDLQPVPDTIDDNVSYYIKNLIYTDGVPITLFDAKKIITSDIWKKYKDEN